LDYPSLQRNLRRERLARLLRAQPELITVENASSTLGISREQAAKTLARWREQGLLSRIRRGVYAAVPLASSPDDRVVEDLWTFVPAFFAPGYIAAATAAQHWDLTEQLFRTIFVRTTRPVRRTNQTVYGTKIVVRHVQNTQMFGTMLLWRQRIRVQVSDVHRTVIDMLDIPSDGGGIRHVDDCLRTYLSRSDASPELLISYGDRLGNGAVFKRLGFLLEAFDGPTEIIEACAARLTKGYANLDPAVSSPRISRRWRLRLPERWAPAPRD
jgi:predicted transcriptional regulator of viral defense system